MEAAGTASEKLGLLIRPVCDQAFQKCRSGRPNTPAFLVICATVAAKSGDVANALARPTSPTANISPTRLALSCSRKTWMSVRTAAARFGASA